MNEETSLSYRLNLAPHSPPPPLGQIFRGDMTQVSLWERALAPAEVMSMAACTDAGRGDLFASDTFQLEVVGVRESRLNLSSLCQ